MNKMKLALENRETTLVCTKKSLLVIRQEGTDRGEISNKVEECRTALNMSRTELATNAEIDRSYVYLIEKGKRNPTVKVAKRLAKSLNKNLEELFPN